MNFNLRMTLTFRWALITALPVAAFWGIWYATHGSVPESALMIRISAPTTAVGPAISRWWDVLLGPVASYIILRIVAIPRIWDSRHLWDKDGAASIAFGIGIAVFGATLEVCFGDGQYDILNLAGVVAAGLLCLIGSLVLITNVAGNVIYELAAALIVDAAIAIASVGVIAGVPQGIFTGIAYLTTCCVIIAAFAIPYGTGVAMKRLFTTDIIKRFVTGQPLAGGNNPPANPPPENDDND